MTDTTSTTAARSDAPPFSLDRLVEIAQQLRAPRLRIVVGHPLAERSRAPVMIEGDETHVALLSRAAYAELKIRAIPVDPTEVLGMSGTPIEQYEPFWHGPMLAQAAREAVARARARLETIEAETRDAYR